MDRGVLNKATGSDDSPTPGYLYEEIAKMTLNVNAVPKLVKYLVQRIKKDNPNVKLKTLLVIRHTCRKGEKSFRREIQTSGMVPDVKACLTYSGKPHPLKGDQPFRAVRDAAKETLEAIFDNSQDYSASQSIVSGGGALSGRIQGYGNTIESSPNDFSASQESGRSYFSGGGNKSNDASIKDSIFSMANKVTSTVNEYASNYNSGGTGANSSATYSGEGGRYNNNGSVGAGGKKYGGIGNPNFADPRNEPPTFIDRVKNRLEKFNEQGANSSISNLMGKSGGSSSPYSPRQEMLDSGSYTSPSLGNNNYHTGSHNSYGNDYSSSSRTRQRGQIGGVWGNTTTSEPVPALDPRSPRQNSSSKSRVGQAGTAASDGSYEKALLEELTGSFGVRIVPPKDKLNSFCIGCETLDPEIVMPMIFNLLINGSIDGSTEDTFDWRAQHKALCVCEALIQASGCEAYVDDIDDNAEILEQIIKNVNGNVKSVVRNKAKKVWRLLYGEDPEVENSPTRNETQGNTTEEDLLGFSQTANGEVEGESNGNDMYDMLDTGNQGPGRSVQQQSTFQASMFNGLSVGPTNNVGIGESAPTRGNNMFANMNVKTIPSSNKTNQQPGASLSNSTDTSTNETNLMGILEGTSTRSSSHAITNVENAVNQLDELSLERTQAATTTNVNSHFSFLNSEQADDNSNSLPQPKQGFSFISASEPVENHGKDNVNVGTAFDNLVKTNLSPRRNPIPKQPNMGIGMAASIIPAQPTAKPINPMLEQQQKGTNNGLLSENLHAMYQMRPQQIYQQQYMHAHRQQQMMYQHQPQFNQINNGFLPKQMVYQPQYNQQVIMQTVPPSVNIPSSSAMNITSNPGISPKQADKPDKFEDIVKASMAGM